MLGELINAELLILQPSLMSVKMIHVTRVPVVTLMSMTLFVRVLQVTKAKYVTQVCRNNLVVN